MKTRILLTIGLLMFLICSISSRGATQNAPDKEIITVWNTPEVHNLTSTLILEYNKSHPNLEFKMMPLTAQEPKENLNETRGVAFYSQESDIDLVDTSLLTMVIGRDVIVPVMNAGNPYETIIEQRGVSVKTFRKAVTAGKANWSILLGNEAKEPLKIYVMDDESVTSAISKFLDLNQDVVARLETKPAKEIIRLIQKNKYAIGFCRLLNVAETGQREIAENLKLLPIDKNGNGRIDYIEKIYGTLDDFKRGVWVGKYPRTLINRIYSVSSGIIEDENVAEFLSWVVTDGQQFVEPNGFSELVSNERQSQLNKLLPQQFATVTKEVPRSAKSKPFLFIAFAIVAVAIVSIIVYWNRNIKKRMFLEAFPKKTKIFNESILSVPNGLYFDKTHTWVFMEKDGTVRMGIDDFLQHVTGRYTRVKMKSPGEKVKKNDPLVSLVREGKQINIYAPASGTIKEINEELVTDPSLINRSPYFEGWIYTMTPSNWEREIRFFKIALVYKEWLKSEFTRLKDFFAVFVKPVPAEYALDIVQDGGELKDGILANQSPEVWEDFQTNFIETSE